MFKFKKIAAVLAGTIMMGSTIALAAAANYPAPYVQGGNANVAIVYGSTALNSDLVAVADINTNLQTALASQTATGGTTGTTTVSGEAVTLDSGSTKIWLNTSLNNARTTLTKSDLPNVLGESTFSGNVESKLTSTIIIGSNKVTFAKQPTSSDDPVIGIATSTSAGSPLYNATVTMPAVNFTSADSEGETIHLFGRDFVVSTSTDGSDLVLFSSAQEITLTAGGSNPKTSATITVGNSSYNIELVTGSGTSSATIAVNGVSKAINAGQSRKVNGLDVAVKSVTESNALNTITADLLVGSKKITFTNNSKVTSGEDADPIDGTLVKFTGTPVNLTGLSVAVSAPNSSSDAILPGTSFEDPVFGSFKVNFGGLDSPLNGSNRGMLAISGSGDKGLSLTMTDSDVNTKTFDFVYNATTTFLGDSNNYRIKVQEKANLTENNYTVIGNEDYGHLIQVSSISNNTGSDYTKDKVVFRDIIDSGETYSTDFTSEGVGQVTVDGRQYAVAFGGSGSEGWTTIKYPTSDSASTERVLFPTIETNKNSLVTLYEPQSVNLSGLTALRFPDGDGFTSVSLTYLSGNATTSNWTIGSTNFNATLGTAASSNTNTTALIGSLVYDINGSTTVNMTNISLIRPSGSEIVAPAVVMIEGKDTNSNYSAVIIDAEANSAGSGTDPLGVNSVLFTSPTNYSATRQSDSDITEYIDWWGTHVVVDANTASQKEAMIDFPAAQVSANIAIGAIDSGITSTGGSSGSVKSLGSVSVSDSEVTSVSSKNLVVVGGSCVNSVAQQLLGSSGALCGDGFTTKTSVGSGSFLIQTFASPYASANVATLVAGYNAGDTTNAAKYLTTQTVDTTVGKKYIGTSANVATLQTA